MSGLIADITNLNIAAGLFYLFAAMAGLSAVGLVISRNIVRSAVCLLFTLTGVAGLYFLLGAEFLAAVQLVVYAGGTLILILFGVMLTSKSPFSRFEPKLVEIVLAIVLASVLLVALVLAITSYRFGTPTAVAAPEQGYPVAQLGQALLGDYLLPFEIASVLLLVVMIGAAYLAKARRREGTANGPAETAASRQAKAWS
jgi:NADH:ubiquinone oxidoreductase subunit 6 (subunit J)